MSDYGRFIWYEFITTDTKAAESFYQKVIGWKTSDAGMTDRSYTLLWAGEAMVGGILPTPPTAAGLPPNWMGYIGVADVDQYAARVKAAGGAIHHGPEDIPSIGRFAVASDPFGAMFVLFRGTSELGPPAAPPNTPGLAGWHELHAGNVDKAWEFYSGLFGWKKEQAMDMGAMGVYQIFSMGGPPEGGMMTKTPQTPHPFWLFYFNVEAIDAAAERVKTNGGKILMGPSEVPGGSWIVNCLDPQNAAFALVALKR